MAWPKVIVIINVMCLRAFAESESETETTTESESVSQTVRQSDSQSLTWGKVKFINIIG